MGDEMVQLTITWVPTITLFTILIFGQELFPHLRRSAFLDKACICQDDEKTKQKGIQHLPEYIMSSTRFVMLWNEDYFKSLWCVWEAALFLKHSHMDKSKSMEITPTFTFLITFIGMIAASGLVGLGDCMRVAGIFSSLLKTYGSNPMVFDGCTCLFLCVFLYFASLLFFYFLIQFVESEAAVEHQLKSFRWSQARCHLEEDRVRLGEQVSRLHGSIGAFEEILHTSFLEECKTRLGGSLLPYKSLVTILFPILCAGMARLVLAEDLSSALFVGLSYMLMFTISCPLQIWSAKKYTEIAVRQLGPFVNHHRIAFSLLLTIPCAIQGMPVAMYGPRVLTYFFVKAIDPSFNRPDTLTPLISST
jgi:hypothetical protein